MAGMTREGGCVCGAVRYRVEGEPVRNSVCSCTFCQRRTGSAFGFGAYFKAEQVAVKGRLNTYEHRSDETGRWLRFEFCPKWVRPPEDVEIVQTSALPPPR